MKRPKSLIKGILIDVSDQTVKEVELDRSLEAMYKTINCQRVESTMFDDTHEIYVDDEGLFNEENKFFYINGLINPLAGNGLILGFDPEIGDNWSHKLDVDYIRAKVVFMNRRDAAMWLRLNQR